MGSYTKEEQIAYTVDNYINPMLSKIKGSGLEAERVRRHLKNYQKLMSVDIEDLKDKNIDITYAEFIRHTLI